MTDLLPITLSDMIADADREVTMRRHVYPRQVAKGYMKADMADRKIAIMEQIAELLRKTRDTQSGQKRAGNLVDGQVPYITTDSRHT
jgi:hypothetical protein